MTQSAIFAENFSKIFNNAILQGVYPDQENSESYSTLLYSTAMVLIEITNNIKRLIDERNCVKGISIDFKKACDTFDHEIMLRKLYCYGVLGHANMYFRSNLINRRQFTVANGVQSDLNNAKIQAKELFYKLYHWCVAKQSVNSDKKHFVSFHMNNKPVPNDLTAFKQTTWR